DRLGFVYADADRLHLAGRAELVERLVGTLHGLLKHARLGILAVSEAVDVMKQQDVDAVHATALHAVLVGTHDAIIGVVEVRLERERIAPRVGRILGAAPGRETATALGGEDKAATITQLVADQVLGAAVTVERRGVEIADAR